MKQQQTPLTPGVLAATGSQVGKRELAFACLWMSSQHTCVLFLYKRPSLTLTPAFTIAVDVMTQNKQRGGVRLPFVWGGRSPSPLCRGRISPCRWSHFLPRLTAPDRYLNMNLRAALMWKRADRPALCPGPQLLWQTQRPVRVIPVGAGKEQHTRKKWAVCFLDQHLHHVGNVGVKSPRQVHEF